MTGGTIRENSATNFGGSGLYEAVYISGGGVYIAGSGSVTGGTISGNTVSGSGAIPSYVFRHGGGVYIGGSGSSFTKSGGGVIYGNDAANDAFKNTASSGNAVYYDGSSARSRNSTLGEADNISTNTQTGWGL
jgi:hypothetical protein